jgi:hypothetical protein
LSALLLKERNNLFICFYLLSPFFFVSLHSDPDSAKHDGIYSGYFTGFLPTPGARYQVTWVVAGEDARVPTIVGREAKSLPAEDSADDSGLTSLGKLHLDCGLVVKPADS